MLSILQAYLLIRDEVMGKQIPPGVDVYARRLGIEQYMKQFDLDDATYEKVSATLLAEMELGLGRTSNASAVIKMFPTYVRALPDGSEIGDYLALDLGGTNFRVLLITLNGTDVSMKNKIFPISEQLMLGHGDKLFDYIAQCIAEFMKAHKLVGKKLPLGFTFSFPLRQEGLASGRLVSWTKGFKCEGVEGNDVVDLLHKAIKRRKDIEVQCVAVLNDTVGCLMSCAFSDHNTEIGVILGTGTNACYMEKLDKVGTWNEAQDEPNQVIINTEWGAFGSNGAIDFIRTDADRAVDDFSLNKGKQIYEKMISGMYMGEIARRAIVECVHKNQMLEGEVTSEMDTPLRFYTKYISEIEKDNPDKGMVTNTQMVMDELGYDSVSVEDCRNIHYICHLVGKRAAYLASAGIATLLNRINKPNVTVAVDGSLYRFHPLFHDLMTEKINQLIKPGLKFSMMLSEDGSGKGAALVAAVAHRLNTESQKSTASSARSTKPTATKPK